MCRDRGQLLGASSLLLFEAGSPLFLSLYSRLLDHQLAISPVSITSLGIGGLGLQMHDTHQGFYMGSRDQTELSGLK